MIWEMLSELIRGLDPIAALFLAAMEAIIPPIPLTAVVGLNVASFGVLRGFLYSWLGTCAGCTVVFLLFHLVSELRWVRRLLGGERISRAVCLVNRIGLPTLFLIAMLPFTPSAFLNFAFGICAYPRRRFLLTLYPAKAVMIGSLSVFGGALRAAEQNPCFLLLAAVILVLLYIISNRVMKEVEQQRKNR